MADLLAKVGRRANVRSNGPHILRHNVLFTSRDEGRAGARFRSSRDIAIWRRKQNCLHLSLSAVADAIRLLDGPMARGAIVETASR